MINRLTTWVSDTSLLFNLSKNLFLETSSGQTSFYFFLNTEVVWFEYLLLNTCITCWYLTWQLTTLLQHDEHDACVLVRNEVGWYFALCTFVYSLKFATNTMFRKFSWNLLKMELQSTLNQKSRLSFISEQFLYRFLCHWGDSRWCTSFCINIFPCKTLNIAIFKNVKRSVGLNQRDKWTENIKKMF